MDLLHTIAGLAAPAIRNYITPRRQRNPRRQRRRGMKRGARVSARVPTRTVMQGSFSGSIRNYFTVPSANNWYKSILLTDLLGDAFSGLASQFGECRVNSLRVYYSPNGGTDSSGQYAAALVDTTTVKAKTLTFSQITGLPGSSVRKLYQQSGYRWKWTEPSDAEFNTISSSNPIADFFISSNSTGVNIGGDLIVDASVILRSLGAQVSEHPLIRHVRMSTIPQNVRVQALQILSESVDADMVLN